MQNLQINIIPVNIIRKRLANKMQNYKNIGFILIFSFFKKIFIFFLFSQLKLNIIFINNKKIKLNLNFKKNNNINNVFFKY